MNSKSVKQIGGATAAALASVVADGAKSISVANAGSREAFLDAWARTLTDHARYLRSNSVKLQAPVVVVHVPHTGEFQRKTGWKKRAMFGASHLDNFAGTLAAGTMESGACVYPDQLDQLQSHEDQIRAANLQSSPTIGLMSESKLVVWPDGLDGDLEPFERTLEESGVIIDLDAMDQALNRFYETVARQTKKWWKDTALRTTIERPEAVVQENLWVFLLASFYEVALIRQEDVSGNGRSDITVHPIKHREGDQKMVLELKALRDVMTPKEADINSGAVSAVPAATSALSAVRKSATKKPAALTKKPTKISEKERLAWALSGVQQTAAYRDKEKCDIALLCLYDFCVVKSIAIFNSVTPHALLHGVAHRLYWITASHKEHRDDAYPLGGAHL